MEWRHSLAPGSARRAPGAGGRKDLVWERGKAARESGLVTSLSEQAQKQRRTRGGARGSDPGESHPGRRGCPGSSRGSWSSWGSLRRRPGGQLQLPPCMGRIWECEAAVGLRAEHGSVCARGSLDSEFRSEGQRVPPGDVPLGPGPFSSYKSG